ncbi:MAG: hypothetical protein LBH84_09850 [Prevotellaceae bacterium]|jgi:hypothetical protein|nr:hypothetical protein [Prevotellaceae bacterium]
MFGRLRKVEGRKFIVFIVFAFCFSATAAAAEPVRSKSQLLSSRSAIGDWLGLDIRPYGGLSVGILSFYGDVRPYNGHHWLSGYPGAKLDLSLEIGQLGELGAKFGFMYAYLKESQTSPFGVLVHNHEALPNSLPPNLAFYEEGNLNFRSNLFNIALQGEYRIRVIPGLRDIYPYISTGINILFFNPYADRMDADGVTYEKKRLDNYNPSNPPLNPNDAFWPVRDKKHETKLKSAKLYNQNISTVTIGFPIEVGFDFKVLPTVNIRFGTSFTITLSDNIDGVSGKAARKGRLDQNTALNNLGNSYWNDSNYEQTRRAARLQANGYNDFFAYTYVACYVYLPFL